MFSESIYKQNSPRSSRSSRSSRRKTFLLLLRALRALRELRGEINGLGTINKSYIARSFATINRAIQEQRSGVPSGSMQRLRYSEQEKKDIMPFGYKLEFAMLLDSRT